MSSPNSFHFKDYVFGEQDPNVGRYQPSVPPMSTSPSTTTSLSPQQKIRSKQPTKATTSRLTKEMLEKKELIDILLEPSTSRKRITRRRSISNGNVSRRLYNDDNTPIRIIRPFRKTRSDDSDVSVHSAGSYRETVHTDGRKNKQKKQQQQHQQIQHHSTIIPSLSSPKRNNRSSHRGLSYNSSITNEKQSTTNSRSVNTSRASLLHQDPWGYPYPFTAEEASRRFSGIVRLSVAHLALQRSKKNKKRHYSHSTLHAFFRKVMVMAVRVIDCRAAEPKETRMAVDELVSLSKYIDKLKSGFSRESDSSSSSSGSSSDTSILSDQSGTTKKMNTTIELCVDENNTTTTTYPKYNTFNHEEPASSSVILYNSNKRIGQISSLENIFPFTPISHIESSSSSSASEASETDRLLSPRTKKTKSSRVGSWRIARFSLKNSCFRLFSKCVKFVRHDLCHPLNAWHKQTYEDNTVLIRFEGWSLFFFSPTSTLRFHLWKVIGSRWFEIFMFVCLLGQWVLLSFAPSLFNGKQPLFNSFVDYMLLIINIIYTFEIISKIIVYGLVLNTHSTTRPTLKSWIHRKPSHFSIFSNSSDTESDHSSTYNTQSHDSRLPAYANTTGNSLSSRSSFHSYPIYYDDSQSGSRSANTSAPPRGSSNSGSNRTALFIDSPTGEHHHSDHTRSREGSSSEYHHTAEQQVLASLIPFPCYHELDEDSDIDFLKVTHRSFLSTLTNVIDLISVSSYWIDLMTVWWLGRHRPWSVFQACAAMRLLRLLTLTEGTTVIMTSLKSSYAMLKNVMGFFVFFWLLFSLVALFLFMNAFSQRCAIVVDGGGGEKIQYVEPRISCSGYMVNATTRLGPLDIRTGIQHAQHDAGGLFCKVGQICIQDVANQPEHGYMSYENIGYAMLNVLTVISTENWTDLLYMTQDSVSNIGAALFYSFCIYLMTFIMVPMFIAVITTSFSHIRGDMRESAFSSQKKTSRFLSFGNNNNQKQYTEEEEEEEEWICEGTGLGGILNFQIRSRFKKWVYTIVHAKWFPYVGSVVSVFNVFGMTFYNSDMTPEQIEYFEFAMRVYTFIFAFEIIFRLYGSLNWTQFWSKYRNRIDLVIAVTTLIDEVPLVRQSQYHIVLLVFSVLRSYRMSYLFPGVLQLLSDVIGDGQGIVNLTFFTFLVLLLLAPISVQLYGGDFGFISEDEPSMRFDNSYQAFLALFQIMTGENWTDILYDAMHSQEHASVAYAAIFMVFLYFAVHYIVLNLFIAVIMENYDLDEEEIKQIQIKKYIREHQWKPEYFKMDKISRFLLPIFILQDAKKLSFNNLPQNLVAQVTGSKFKDFLRDEENDGSADTTNRNLAYFSFTKNLEERRPSSLLSQKTARTRKDSILSTFSNNSAAIIIDDDIVPTTLIQEPDVKYGDEYELNVARENKAVIVDNLNVFRSIIFLKKDNWLRKKCIQIAQAPYYNRCMLVSICVSTVLAMWSDESNRNEYPWVIKHVLDPLHILLLLFYWVDIAIHMVADGVFMLPKSYIRTTWNLLDLLNLTCQSVLIVLDFDQSGFVYAGYLRILRVLRAMRIVYYTDGMRVIFLDLIYGLPKMIDAVALNFIVFVPFAIYGCYLFSGRFFSCNDDSVGARDGCWGEFQATDDGNKNILVPRVWKNPHDYSYDSFGKSLLHLFECASGEGWIVSLFSAMSVQSNDKNLQPQFSWSGLSIFHSLYYVVFMFVASVCSIQLFIGVFLEIFKQRSGISSLTSTQRQFQDLQRQLALVKPSLKTERPTESRSRAFFYDLVIDKRGKFAGAMATVLTVHIIIFATEHLHQPEWLSLLQDILNVVCLCCYVFEMAAKIAGLGFDKWASVKWNIYDCVFVGLALITSMLHFFTKLPFVLQVVRKLSQVGIAFRLAQRNESLDTLFRSVKCALPSIYFVSSVFGIVIICFGVTFQELFSLTRYGPYGNEHANFRSLFNSVLTLFRITTGENWDFLMHDFTVVPPECVGKDDCGSPKYAIALFIVFYVVCTFIFVNLFTVIVIDNFSFTFDKRNQFTLITRTDLRQFKIAWSEVDPMGSGYISVKQVPKFLSLLDGVLSVKIYEKEHKLKSLIDATSHIGNNVSHLITIPISEAKSSATYAANNGMKEKLFNLYELNKKISSIDSQVIKMRKKRYTEVYKEVVNSASHRGVAFHQMLETLAIRLVDISKSLTFDELVNRARIQDKVSKDLSTERAKGFVSMLILRRSYLKQRQKARSTSNLLHFTINNKNNLTLLGNWLTIPNERLSTPNSSSSTKSGSYLQTKSPLKKSSKSSYTSNESNSSSGVPKIVIDQARKQDIDVPVTNNKEENQHTLQLPDRFASFSKSPSDEVRRRKSTTITPVTLGSLLNKSSSSTTISIKPEPLVRRPSKRRMSMDSLLSETHVPLRLNLGPCNIEKDKDEEDVFIHYYSIDQEIETMNSTDAHKIIMQFQNSTWSNLLTSQSNDENHTFY